MLPGESPVRLTLWDVVSVEFKVEEDPYALVRPYATWLSLLVLVVQVIVADDWVIFEAKTLDIIGALGCVVA